MTADLTSGIGIGWFAIVGLVLVGLALVGLVLVGLVLDGLGRSGGSDCD